MPSKGSGGGRSRGSGGASRSVKPAALGFKSSGVVKGSTAAKLMSSQGSVKAGSPVAKLQSQGAKGGAPSRGSTPSGASKSVQLSALGFKSGGVEKGSVGAKMMASQGSVPPGSVIAKMQSSSAKGTSGGVACETWPVPVRRVCCEEVSRLDGSELCQSNTRKLWVSRTDTLLCVVMRVLY